jgi:hypothetical protein
MQIHCSVPAHESSPQGHRDAPSLTQGPAGKATGPPLNSDLQTHMLVRVITLCVPFVWSLWRRQWPPTSLCLMVQLDQLQPRFLEYTRFSVSLLHVAPLALRCAQAVHFKRQPGRVMSIRPFFFRQMSLTMIPLYPASELASPYV